MKVSIIISSYNHKEYTKEAIDSCLNQDYLGEYELIIGDDGSTDGSIELIKKYALQYPKKIKFFVMDRNDCVDIMGIRSSNIREKGAQLSSGEYLLFLDGDDIITKDKLRVQVEFLDNHENYVACFTDFELFWENGKRKQYIFNYHRISNCIYWGGDCYMHLSCFIFRRCVINNFVPFHVVDNIATFAILKSGKIFHIPGITYYYRQREKSIMHSIDIYEKRIREVLFFQFIINSGGYHYSTIKRYSWAIDDVFSNKNLLSNPKYQKFFEVSSFVKKDYLLLFRDYYQLSWKKRMSIHFFFMRKRLVVLTFKILKRIINKNNNNNKPFISVCEYTE